MGRKLNLTDEQRAKRAESMRRNRKQGGGRIVPRLEVARREWIVEQLYVETRSTRELIRRLGRGIADPDDVEAARVEGRDPRILKMSKSAVMRYLDRVRTRWHEENKGTRASKQEWYVRKIVEEIRRRRAPVASLMRLLAEIEGMIGPQKHEHVHVGAASLGEEMFKGWTAAQLRAFVERGEKPGQVRPDHGSNGAGSNGAGSNGAGGSGNGAAH